MKKTKTWISPNPKLEEIQIDHVAIFRYNFLQIKKIKVKKGVDGDSSQKQKQKQKLFQKTGRLQQLINFMKREIKHVNNYRDI